MTPDRGIKDIPKGDYCHDKDMKPCPYWSIDPYRPEQFNGYCSYLRKGDWDINKTVTLTDIKTGEVIKAEEVGFPASLLWDQCKECGINMDDDEEEEEEGESKEYNERWDK